MTLLLLPISCAYRFTNQHVVRPMGIRSIAVEAIYDTSREVLPHEMLWQAFQDSFAANGHLHLTSQNQADALLRAHLREASITPQGAERINGPERDPQIVRDIAPPGPNQYRPLTQAGRIRDTSALGFVVDVEVWNLRTRTLMLRKTYPMKKAFRSVHAGDSVTTLANDYLRYDEAAAATFKTASEELSQRVVQDLLIR